ncbi:MAG: hypothetical protein HKN41_03655 [Ilumatobacter sp.]|nr:hypothetical protein [Ilumatobacter sp.]
MRRRAIGVAIVLAVAAVAPTTGVAGGHDAHHAARTVRRATVDLRTPDDAEAAGYGQFLTCVREPGVGAMGTHWVNGDLVADTVLDPATPEAIMYETARNGKLRIVGVEYLVFQEPWDALHASAPTLFGQRFHLVDAPNRYGLPPFYALHVWAWRHNPDGTFQNWNPRVTCDHASGDPI